nr:DUF2004 domain-containing protein [uncultured Kingella sp.]
MATLNHPYFGLLDSDTLADEVDVLWEHDVALNGHAINAQIWAAAESELDVAELDQFAQRLQNLAELDHRARAALQEYLADDDSYLTHHREEMEGGDALPTAPADFVAAMTLNGIALWHQDPFDEGGGPLVLDYMIDPDHSDEILDVSVTAAGEIEEINWES